LDLPPFIRLLPLRAFRAITAARLPALLYNTLQRYAALTLLLARAAATRIGSAFASAAGAGSI